MKRIAFLAALMLSGLAAYAQSWESRYEADPAYTVENTRINGRDATIIQPAVPNGRWIVRPAFMGAFPQVDEALLERGWTFGYYDVTEQYANPAAQDDFTAFYEYARKKYNLSSKVTLEGLSRGGFFSLVYAENNPEKIDHLYLDAPLCDLHLLKGRTLNNYDKVAALWAACGVDIEDVHDFPRKHFDAIKALPIIVVYGAADEVVHFEQQFGTFDLSGCRQISIIGKTGCGHHPHSLSPCDTIVNFIMKPADLPRQTPTRAQQDAFEGYLKAVEDARSDIHSIMVLQHGEVLFEKWMGVGALDKPHALFSCSKTFTSTAVGFAIAEGYLSLDDKVISFFPDRLPRKKSRNLKAMTIRDLLTMSCGHATDPTYLAWNSDQDWVSMFLSREVTYAPGTAFCYNSLGTFMLSAIVQQKVGQNILEYLTPRLFQPLGIEGATWDMYNGICCGGWGLSLKTEDLAKMGQCLLQGGRWQDRQVIPQEWVREMSSRQVQSLPGGQPADRAAEILTPQMLATNDWCQGYGYQMWRCRHNAFRADGASSQYIIVLPDQDAVVVTTAHDDAMQNVLNLIWDKILPALE